MKPAKKPTSPANRKLPTAVLVGRINVGKSTLFNRMTESGRAIVSDVPGTTRDRNYGSVIWRGKTFNLVDSGGVDVELLRHGIAALASGKKRTQKLLRSSSIDRDIIKQTRQAVAEANVVILVTDAKAGLLPDDRQLALTLKKLGKPILLATNKADGPKQRQSLDEFYRLGVGEPHAVSAINGSGIGDLLDALFLLLRFPAGRPAADRPRPVHIALIGKPNVGKSSLVNSLLGQERVIVSDQPHTTREPQDTEIVVNGQPVVLIDTAGLRKLLKVHAGIEREATRRSEATLRRADVALFVTEAHQSLTTLDSHLAGMIKDAGVGLVVIGNKWDVVGNKDTKIAGTLRKYYQQTLPFLGWAPILFTSATTKQGVDSVLPEAIAVQQRRQQELDPQALDKLLHFITRKHLPVKAHGPQPPKIQGLIQTGSNPPEFTVLVGPEQSIHFSYLRFIENQIRDHFDFSGVPIKLRVKARKE